MKYPDINIQIEYPNKQINADAPLWRWTGTHCPLVACHATLHPAILVGWSVGLLFGQRQKFLLHPLPTSGLISQPRGPYLSLEAQIPVLRLKFLSQGSNPSLEAKISFLYLDGITSYHYIVINLIIIFVFQPLRLERTYLSDISWRCSYSR